MSQEESDAQVLSSLARCLFAESLALFREGHERGMQSFNALTPEVHLKLFGEALKMERQAILKQGEAIELQRRALTLRANMFARSRGAED